MVFSVKGKKVTARGKPFPSKEKAFLLREVGAGNPGSLPMRIRVKYPTGAVVAVELEGGVRPTEALLAELGKIAAKDDWGVDVKSEIFAEPPEKRWQRSN